MMYRQIQTAALKESTRNGNLQKELQTVDYLFNILYSIIPNPDTRIMKEGIKVYDKTMADPVVRGSSDTIIESVNALEYQILVEGKNSKEVDLDYAILKNLFGKGLKKEILMSKFYGSQYIDLIWGEVNGYLVPVDFVIKAHESFFYKKNPETKKTELWVRTETNQFNGEVVPAYKLLVPTDNLTPDNPYGKGLLSNCYKSVFIKNNAWNFWSIFVEDHGTPKLDAEISKELVNTLKNERGWSEDTILNDVQDNLEILRQNGVFTHFEGIKVAALNSGASDNGVTHNDLMKYCDQQLSILLLGHNGTSQATPGKLGNDTTALTILDIRRDAYANFVANKVNTLLQWVHDLNFGEGAAPEVEFFVKNDIATYKTKAELVQILTGAGVKFNADYYQDEFNLDKKYFEVGAPPSTAPTTPTPAPEGQDTEKKVPEKKAPEKKKEDEAIPDGEEKKPGGEDKQEKKKKAGIWQRLKDRITAAPKEEKDDLDTLNEFSDYVLKSKDYDGNKEVIDAICSFVDKAESYEEMLDDLYHLYPDLPFDNLKKLVTRMLLVSRTFGNSSEAI